MFEYGVCNKPDDEMFKKQCSALVSHIPGLTLEQILDDADGSRTAAYRFNSERLFVHNSYYSNELYIESTFDIDPYFK